MRYSFWNTEPSFPCLVGSNLSAMALCKVYINTLHSKRNWWDYWKEELDEFEVKQGPNFGHHQTGSSLKSSATEGYTLCLHFWKQFTDEEQEALVKLDGDGYVSSCSLQRVGQYDESFVLLDIRPDSKGISTKQNPNSSFALQLSSGKRLPLTG